VVELQVEERLFDRSRLPDRDHERVDECLRRGNLIAQRGNDRLIHISHRISSTLGARSGGWAASERQRPCSGHQILG
jgi:hypothetical protein